MNKYLTELKAAVAHAVKHPESARKAVVAALIHAGALVAVFATVVHVSGGAEVLITSVTAFLNGTVVFLTSNEVVKDATAVEARTGMVEAP